MNSKDISQIKKASDDYRKMSSDLALKHKGQWDDSVHDSFVHYNKQVADSSDCISRIYDSTKIIAESLTDNKDLITDANRVLSEVKTL